METIRKRLSALMAGVMLVSIFSSLSMSPQRAFAATYPQLKNIPRANFISYGGQKWILVDPSIGYLTTWEAWPALPFDEDGRNAINPADPNNIGYWLNDETNGFLKTLSDGSADLSWIQATDWDQPEVEDFKVGMLNRGEWSVLPSSIHREILKPSPDLWTRTRSSSELLETVHLYQDSRDGYRISWTVINARVSLPVRPAICLNPEFYAVSGTGSFEDPYQLAPFPYTSLIASASSVAADGIADSTISVSIADYTGPVAGRALTLVPSAGSSVVANPTVTTDASGTATFTVTDAHMESVTYTVRDTTGNFNLGTVPINFHANVEGVVDGQTYDADRTVSFVGGGAATLNDNGVSSPFTVTEEGVYTLVIAGANTTETVHFTIDKDPTVTGVVDGGLDNEDRIIAFSDGTATLDEVPFANNTAVSAEGEHTLVVKDAANRMTTVRFTIDKTAPTVALSSTAGGTVNAPFPVTVSFSEVVRGFEVGDITVENGSVSDFSSVSAAVYTATIRPTALGRAVTVHVEAGAVSDAATNGNPESNWLRVVYNTNNGGSGGGGSTPAVPPAAAIDLNGIPYDPVKIDATKPSISLEVAPKDGFAYASIPASTLASLEGKNSTFLIEIKTPYGSYQVPVHLASLIPGLKELLAKNNLKTDDISFKITLSEKSGDKQLQTALKSGLPDGKVLGAIVDFGIEIVVTKTGKSIETGDRFSKALTRVIPMPKSLTEMPAQWGAFRYDETNGKFEYVPALSVKIDGVQYAMIRSYSNSVYVVAENDVTFIDIQKHWGEPVHPTCRGQRACRRSRRQQVRA